MNPVERFKSPRWSPTEDSLILENLVGSSNISKSAQELAKIINRNTRAILVRYYGTLKVNQGKSKRRYNRKTIPTDTLPLPTVNEQQRIDDIFTSIVHVTRYVCLYDKEWKTQEEATMSNINYIIEEINEEPKVDLHEWMCMNEDKVLYLLKNKPKEGTRIYNVGE